MVGRALTNRLAREGLPRVRLHDRRHTAATLMLEAGVPANVASERLGHSSIAIAIDHYSHVTERMQKGNLISRYSSSQSWKTGL
jgi:integrase